MKRKKEKICPDCATREGAVWPVGQSATHEWDTCDWCTCRAAVCEAWNWNWPEERDSHAS